jgi:hypothetical protein
MIAKGRIARTATSRTATQRPVADDSDATLFFPVHEVPEGMVYQWLSETVLGQPNTASLNINFRKGWRPVPAERHPQYASTDFYGAQQDPFIRSGAAILAERPIEACEQAEEQLLDRRRSLIESLDYETARQMDPSMPYLDPDRRTRYERPQRKGGRFED